MSDAVKQAVESIRDLIDIVDRPDREIFLKALNAIDALQAMPPVANRESIIDLLKSAQGYCRLGFAFAADDTIQSVINLLSESKDNNNE